MQVFLPDCSLCDLSVLCFRIAEWVSPYLKRSALGSNDQSRQRKKGPLLRKSLGDCTGL